MDPKLIVSCISERDIYGIDKPGSRQVWAALGMGGSGEAGSGPLMATLGLGISGEAGSRHSGHGHFLRGRLQSILGMAFLDAKSSKSLNDIEVLVFPIAAVQYF